MPSTDQITNGTSVGVGRKVPPLDIAIAIHKLSPRGGLEDNCIRIAEELGRRGHRVTVYVGKKPEEQDLPTIVLAAAPQMLTNHAQAQAFANRFQIATKGRFDRTVAFHPIPGVDFLFLADPIRDRLDTPFLKRLTPRFRGYARLELGCFGPTSDVRIIGLARPQMREFARRYPGCQSRIAIVPPTLPIARRRPELRTAERRTILRSELGIPAEAPVWLWLGLQPRVKGLDRVMEALTRKGEIHLLIGGLSRVDRKAVAWTKLAKQLGVEARIHWMGYIQADRLFAAMAAADLLVHPARTDVTGGVILEALINGLPVVTTEVCGFSTHVAASGSGAVVREPFDQAAFENAITGLMEADLTEMSRLGVEYGSADTLYSGISVACDLIESWKVPADRRRLMASSI